jgi:hypothetical protein
MLKIAASSNNAIKKNMLLAIIINW